MPHGGQHPTEETMNITRKFLGGELGTVGQPPGEGQAPSTRQPTSVPTSILPRQSTRLPSQAAPVAQRRAFGQQGARRGLGGSSTAPSLLRSSPSLSSSFFDLPGPVDFSRTPQGQAILQRILGLRGVR